MASFHPRVERSSTKPVALTRGLSQNQCREPDGQDPRGLGVLPAVDGLRGRLGTMEMERTDPAHPIRWSTRVDVGLVFLVLTVSVCVASFAARNSDLWLHLATGRLISSGDLPWGGEPFTFTASSNRWANHSWLFDLVVYWGHEHLGGPWLVAAKALMVAGTAALMVAAAGGARWISAGCVLLGVLAMSPRLLLQPAVGSYFLLSACLACLIQGRWLALVPVMVALWVNLDAWFILGPILVLLFWFGRFWERAPSSPWPSWLIPATLAACLMGPHHVHALSLPMELDPAVWAGPFASDPRIASIFAPPGLHGGYNASAWAFEILLALGGASFLARPSAARTGRGLVWIVFASLAVWQARLIPLFAVVGAPIAAANWIEAFPVAVESRWGRVLAVVLAAVALPLALSGWTTGIHVRDRGLAWNLHPDAGLVRAATECRRFLPGTRLFNSHPELGHYLAWHAPEIRYAIDSRLPLFTRHAADYEAACASLGLIGQSVGEAVPVGADVLAVWDPDPARVAKAARVSDAWKLAGIEGSVILLARTSTRPRDGFSPSREAFAGSSALPVPGDGPASLSEVGTPQWWPRGALEVGSWQSSEAILFLRLAEGDSGQRMPWQLLAIRAARSGTEADPSDPSAWLAMGRAYLSLGTGGWERELGSESTPLEHFRFIQATAALSQAAALNPGSMAARDSLSRLFARRNILDLAARHGREVHRLAIRQGRAPGETAGDYQSRLGRAKDWADSLDESLFEAENQFLVRTAGQTGDPLARARVAVRLGLVAKAIDILVTTHPDLYGAVGVGLLADLLLQTGQSAECRILLDRPELKQNPDVLGVYNLPRKSTTSGARIPHRIHAYDWLDACASAAAGRYAVALESIDRIIARTRTEEVRMLPGLSRGAAALAASDIALGASPGQPLLRLAGVGEQKSLADYVDVLRHLTGTRADLATLAGILDCERGERVGALDRLSGAMAAEASLPPVGVETLAARYHRELVSAR